MHRISRHILRSTCGLRRMRPLPTMLLNARRQFVERNTSLLISSTHVLQSKKTDGQMFFDYLAWIPNPNPQLHSIHGMGRSYFTNAWPNLRILPTHGSYLEFYELAKYHCPLWPWHALVKLGVGRPGMLCKPCCWVPIRLESMVDAFTDKPPLTPRRMPPPAP